MGSVAVAVTVGVGVGDITHVIWKWWQMTYDMWHVTYFYFIFFVYFSPSKHVNRFRVSCMRNYLWLSPCGGVSLVVATSICWFLYIYMSPYQKKIFLGLSFATPVTLSLTRTLIGQMLPVLKIEWIYTPSAPSQVVLLPFFYHSPPAKVCQSHQCYLINSLSVARALFHSFNSLLV